MVRHLRFSALVLLAGLALALPASAQSPTGSISGQVTDAQGRAVAGAVVTATSPNLQGQEQVKTSPTGAYIFKLLPPGVYTLAVEAKGFAVASESRTIAAAEPVTIDLSLQPATVKENVTVVGDGAQFLNTTEGAANFKQSLISALPTKRDMLSAVSLAPGVHSTPLGSTAISMAGGMTYENSFMVNGVQIQDNLRGTPYSLFIEDAIQETTVMTSGISAEYGRFTGGLVNTLTKSGSNVLSGSLREAFSNDNWRTVSPFNEPKVDDTVPTASFTLGGPILKDRVWFFGAGRFSDAKTAQQTGYTNLPYTREDNEKRFEGKLTTLLAPGQRLEASYIGIRQNLTNDAWPNPASVMDLASLTNPSEPQTLFGLHYTGTFGGKLFVEAQYSARTFAFQHDGGMQSDLINGTTLADQSTGAYWWAPNFCGFCPDETRDNSDLVLKGSYFLSSAAGSHDIVFGYDGFNDKRLADNYQSGSNYQIYTTGTQIDNGTVYPVVDPDSDSTWIVHFPLAASSQGTNYRTHSLFVQDHWAYGRHLSFDLGLRYDKDAGKDSAGTLVAKDSMLSPRVNVSWDPTGTGRTTFRAGFNRYVAAINNPIADQSSAAGNTSILVYDYKGAPINTGDGPLVPTDQVIQQLFDWYNASSANLNDYLIYANVPGIATQIANGLRPQHDDEISFGVSHQLNAKTSVRADVVNRVTHDFYADRIDTSTGQVFDDFGQPYDLKIIQNTNVLSRQYRALILSTDIRPTLDLTVGANYTLSHLWGNDNGESAAAGPLTNDILAYPEYFDPRWSYPTGDLSTDQRHRLRAWALYTLPWARKSGSMSIGVIQQVESGTPYGAVGQIDSTPYVDDLGYATPLSATNYYFTAPDAFRTPTMKRTDVSFNVNRRLAGSTEVFLQVQLWNVFNQFQAYNAQYLNTTVHTNFDQPDTLAPFNPFTDTPVQGVNWSLSSKFGQPISKNAYTQPRTFLFSFGVRF